MAVPGVVFDLAVLCCFEFACVCFVVQANSTCIPYLQCKCIDPDNQGPAGPTCGAPSYKGDGNCDDNNNNKGCAYDGGDCCPKTVSGGAVSKKYCKEVGCG